MLRRTAESVTVWLDANLHRFDGPAQLCGDEPNTALAESGLTRAQLWDSRTRLRVLLAACWDYSQAAGNMAIPLLYRAIADADPGFLADRWYLPSSPRDMELLEKGAVPVFGVETRHPLAGFDVVATSISYPVLFQNLAKYLLMSGVPLRWRDREDRAGDYPMIMVGGQSYCQPEFMAPVADCVWLGEAEDEPGNPGGIGEVCAVIAAMREQGRWKSDRLGCYAELARAYRHLYFPRFTSASYRYEDRGLPELTKMVAAITPELAGMPHPHRARKVKVLDAVAPLVKMPLLYSGMAMGAGDTEIGKGCPAWCTMCQESYVSKPPREHSVGYVTAAAKAQRLAMGAVDISFVAPDPPMHTHARALAASVLENVTGGLDMSSGRVDDYLAGGGFARLLSQGGTTSLTLGLEGPSQRIRDLSGKGLTDDDVCRAVALAIRMKIRKIKLYMITNWPGEERGDIMRVVALGRRLADVRDSFGPEGRKTAIQFSWTPLITQAATPLQWFAVTPPDYRLQEAMNDLRDYHIGVRIGNKAQPQKMAFFQACQRAPRAAGEAIADVLEALGTASWGGFAKDMRARLDAALVRHGYRNGLDDLFGERFEHDLFGYEHISTGVAKSLLWRIYRDMVAFLENTSAETYEDQLDGASANEWVPRCDHACSGASCGACDRADLVIRRELIRARVTERDIDASPVQLLDHGTEACRLRLRLDRPQRSRYISGPAAADIVRRAAFTAAEQAGVPAVARKSVALASAGLDYRDRSAGVEYAQLAFTRLVRPGDPALPRFLLAMSAGLRPWLAYGGQHALLDGRGRLSPAASLWELETGASEEEIAALLRSWAGRDYVKGRTRTDSFYAGQADHEVNAKEHVRDLWAVRKGTSVVLRMMLAGRLGPYQAWQALAGKASWLDGAAYVARRAEFYDSFTSACQGCGGGIPVTCLGAQTSLRFCPRCADAGSGRLVAELSGAAV